MAIEAVRTVSGQELREWRKKLAPGAQRVVSEVKVTPGMSGQDMQVAPRPPKRDARDIRDAVIARRVEAFRRLAEKDSAWFESFIAYYRQAHPEIAALLTDEDIRTMTHEGAMRRIIEHQTEQSVERVFRTQNRNRTVIHGNPG